VRPALFTFPPRYDCSRFPSPCGALPFALAAFEFVRRRRHWPRRANPFGNGFAHCHSHRDGFANAVTHSHRDGFAYAHFGSPSDQNTAAVATGRTPNRQELLAYWRHFDGGHRAKCGWVRVRADG